MMRAKMEVQTVTRFKNCEKLELQAVSSKPYNPNGENEDNTYSLYTPSATFSILINNPSLLGKFNPGDKFYIDFTRAD